jgi:DNA-3-methyladenine glycosylase II
MVTTVRGGSPVHAVRLQDRPESILSSRDERLAKIISVQYSRWPLFPTEDPIWGLLRIVIAQQISTTVACRISEKLKAAFPAVTQPRQDELMPDLACLVGFGLPRRRAECCVSILHKSEEIRARISSGESWEVVLHRFKGIGPWTLAVFRIMVLREPDVLPLGDVGLERAIAGIYGSSCEVEKLAENWRPFRSVACWYLWKTLGNEQLG